MAISKITLNGVVQIDLTADTVTAQTLLDDYVAHGADGESVTGELVMPTARTASDVTVSGATVTIPSGAYASQVQKSVATGTAGTPSVTKTVDTSDASAEIVPSVTNVTGYITGGTKTGSTTYVTARELVSGNSITADMAGQWDVYNYETLTIPQGTAGTPTASKGSVVNNSISVTPSVTNVTGYITGGTKSGTAVTVTAQEIVAGNTLYCDDSGNWNVANTETFVVQAGTAGTPSATKGTVSNHSVSVTPSVTNSEGWISSGTKTGTAVTVTASELASGNKAITENGTGIDVVGYSTVSVDVASQTGFTATITRTGTSGASNPYVKVNGTDTSYFADGATFTFGAEDTLAFTVGNGGGGSIYENGTQIASDSDRLSNYSYTPPKCDIALAFYYAASPAVGRVDITYTEPTISITQNGIYDVYDYSKAEVYVGGGGLDADYKAVLNNTATNPSFPSEITTIGQYKFYGMMSLTTLVLPNTVTGLGQYAFYNCYNLTSITWSSSLTTIGSYAFQLCYGLSGALTLPSSVKTINMYAFSRCKNITSISCDGVITTLGLGAFAGNSSYLMAIEEAYFPNLTNGNSALTTVFGNTTVANACQQLEVIDLGNLISIGTNSFANCYKLQTIIIRRTSVCSLTNVSAFTNTPLDGYNGLTGTVYVPNALISTYQITTNWKTLYDAGTVSFVKIEGSIYELS